ncbi:MAG: TetR/AcrR family transcriptional regulator [Actinomycetota bacterium]
MPRARKAPADVDVRTALLDAAGELLSREGPAALTTRRLAATAGTTTQSIYTLFGGKEGVVRAMFREGYTRLHQRLEAVERTEDPLVDLRELGRAYRAAALASPYYYDVMFGRPVAEFTPDRDDLALARLTQDCLTAGIQRVLDAGHLRPGAVASEIAQWLWAVTHGVVSLELVGALHLAGDSEPSPHFDDYLTYSLSPFVTH